MDGNAKGLYIAYHRVWRVFCTRRPVDGRFRRERPSKTQLKSATGRVGYPSHGTRRTGATGTAHSPKKKPGFWPKNVNVNCSPNMRVPGTQNNPYSPDSTLYAVRTNPCNPKMVAYPTKLSECRFVRSGLEQILWIFFKPTRKHQSDWSGKARNTIRDGLQEGKYHTGNGWVEKRHFSGEGEIANLGALAVRNDYRWILMMVFFTQGLAMFAYVHLSGLPLGYPGTQGLRTVVFFIQFERGVTRDTRIQFEHSNVG
ncbi:hypothetical protein C8J57DRAFT_1257917 [Mycena rebaudengoi]|nr:hypothetical protein C8J57DRAFT_1257917 [Mycena rebaudengoi]